MCVHWALARSSPPSTAAQRDNGDVRWLRPAVDAAVAGFAGGSCGPAETLTLVQVR